MFAGLPDHCFSTSRTTGQVIAIKRGEPGYYPIQTRSTAKKLNEVIEVTTAQVEAMEAGSMFGWDVPGANPALYGKKEAKPCQNSKRMKSC